MSEPTFTREATTNLYWADPAEPIAGFLATDAAALGANPTLTLTWGDQRGSYLFLPEPAAAEFLAALIDWLGRFGVGERPRFMWIANPAEPPTAWSAR